MGPTMSTEVLCLLNMVTEEELRDDEEFEGRSISFDSFVLVKEVFFCSR